MSIKIEDIQNGMITMRIAGKLQHPELVATHHSLAAQIADGEKAAVLVDAREFDGWAQDGDWGDLDTQYEMDSLILKMAIVVDPKWETLTMAFTGKGLRPFPIEIFAPSDFPEAEAWLANA
jgi:hypothetical protein